MYSDYKPEAGEESLVEIIETFTPEPQPQDIEVKIKDTKEKRIEKFQEKILKKIEEETPDEPETSFIFDIVKSGFKNLNQLIRQGTLTSAVDLLKMTMTQYEAGLEELDSKQASKLDKTVTRLEDKLDKETEKANNGNGNSKSAVVESDEPNLVSQTDVKSNNGKGNTKEKSNNGNGNENNGNGNTESLVAGSVESAEEPQDEEKTNNGNGNDDTKEKTNNGNFNDDPEEEESEVEDKSNNGNGNSKEEPEEEEPEAEEKTNNGNSKSEDKSNNGNGNSKPEEDPVEDETPEDDKEKSNNGKKKNYPPFSYISIRVNFTHARNNEYDFSIMPGHFKTLFL